MSDLLFVPQKSLLYVSGSGSLLYRPDSFAALAGVIRPERIPVSQGPWFSYLKRFFQPDRFRLTAGVLDGRLWLGTGGAQNLMVFSQTAEMFVVTDKMLCCSAAARSDAFLLRLLPGSVRKAICITRCQTAEKQPVCVAGTGVPAEIQIEENEELKVGIHSLVAWQGCQKPKSFCPRLRWRDLILPRLPQNLVLTFRGPGRVWVEAPVDMERQNMKRR